MINRERFSLSKKYISVKYFQMINRQLCLHGKICYLKIEAKKVEFENVLFTRLANLSFWFDMHGKGKRVGCRLCYKL